MRTEKEKNFEKQLLLCSAVLVTLISMAIKKHERVDDYWQAEGKSYY